MLHHGITSNYLDYPYSTVRYVFGLASANQKGCYTHETLPLNLAHAYLPAREQLPKGWMMTREGLIVPPVGVFRAQIIEDIFKGSREAYLETGMQGVSYTTGVPAMIGAMMFMKGLWNTPGVHNVEEFDPDPFMEQLNKQGLPWHEIYDGDLEL